MGDQSARDDGAPPNETTTCESTTGDEQASTSATGEPTTGGEHTGGGEGRSFFSRLPAWIDFRTIFFTVVAGLVGVLIGIVLFTFGYAQGASYLGSDPAACNNCHAMNQNYAAWQKSPHHNVAGCNDCHAPHDNVVHKYYVKAENGFWHSFKFTTGWYPQNIQIRESNRKVTEEACVSCHGDYVSHVNQTRPKGQQITCIQCHADVGHER